LFDFFFAMPRRAERNSGEKWNIPNLFRDKKEQRKSTLLLFLLLPFVFTFFFFCLDTKETKDQGEPERLRPFRRASAT